MHMLYHVPSPQAAARELRRITGSGGRVLVGLNGDDHLRELRDLMVARRWPTSARRAGGQHVSSESASTRGEVLLGRVFTTVVRHDFVSQLLLPGSEPIAQYVRSTLAAQSMPDPQRLVAAVTSRLKAEPGGVLRVRTHSGCLVCE